MLAGNSSEKLRPLQFVWPFVFVAAGVFLAAWSDAEIWPRGNLSWRFLIHHDFEARQHKIYALLLIAIGVIEYLRARGKLSRFWQISGFPLLAVLGAVLLLFHDHTGTSGASLPEARQYLVSGAVSPSNEASPAPMPGMHHEQSMADSSMSAGHSALSTSMKQGHEMSGHDMPGMDMADHDMAANDASHPGHPHQMTAEMLKVEHQHLWYVVVGLAVALFKFISDGTLWRRSLTMRLWPACVTLLGVLLVFYTE